MFRRALVAATTTAGFHLWSSSSAPSNTVYAKDMTAEQKELAELRDATTAQSVGFGTERPKMVIVGGGYSGGKLAYLFDSMFDITLIDTKNYVDYTPDVIQVVATPWDDEKSTKLLDKSLILHRYFLKRANVVTAKVKAMNEEDVTLTDGTKLGYDVLVLALGERKPFPFGTKARTKTQRIAELKAMSKFVEKDCNKIAIVGAGPYGSSLAKQLSESYPEKEVHVYHSCPQPVPSLPVMARHHVATELGNRHNVTMHYSRRVVDTTYDGRSKKFSVAHLKEEHNDDRFVVRSIFHHILFGTKGTMDSNKVHARRVTLPTRDNTDTDGGYDYVFHCTGFTPRTAEIASDAFHKEHLTDTGHYRVSRFLQLFGHPNVFAVGRCNNLPWVRSYGNSEVQVMMLFRAFHNVLTSYTPTIFEQNSGIRLHRMLLPRLLVQFGDKDAFGSTAWEGTMTGTRALREQFITRNQYTQQFTKPVFYKPREAAPTRKAFDQWRAREITDVEDFDVYKQ